jgi:predicted amidohydrolase YtcJ
MRNAVLLFALIGAVSCTAKHTESANFGDVAFVNALVYTVDDAHPSAEAVVIRDDTIIYVGDRQGAEDLIGGTTEVRDLEGRLLLPGFIEAHMHLVDAGRYIAVLELNIGQSVDELTAAIADYAAANPDLPVVFGYGFIASAFGQEGPTRQLIDAVVPDRPVIIMDEGWHTAWVNTAALKALNVTQDTSDLVPGFSYYRRDKNGDATGYLLEDVATAAAEILFPPNEDAIVDGLADVFDIMNSQGITTAFDAGVGDLDGITVKRVFDQVAANDNLTARVFGAAATYTKSELDTAVDRADQWRELVRGDGFHYNALKIFNDGTVEAKTAAMFEDYQGDPGNSGHTVFTESELLTMITGATSRGLDVHIHALGERAVHEALNAIEVTRRSHPTSPSRFTLIHIEVIADQDVARFGELGVIAQPSPLWFSYDDYGKEFVSDDQFARYWRVASLEQSGARLAFGSDFPATGLGVAGMHPLLNIEIGYTRQSPGEPDSLVQPLGTERLSIESLIRGYTMGPAHMLHLEDQIGSIEVGKKADMVVLDQNIFDIDPYSIHETEVVLTMMDGKVVYEK